MALSPLTCAPRCPTRCSLASRARSAIRRTAETLQTFGGYIDAYTIEQAVADNATVPIFYEGRLPELRILGQSLDKMFDRVFSNRSEEEQEAIKKKYATEQSIAEAPGRIEAICLDLIEHYTRFIEPNGFKAQVVCVSREAAVTYKETLDNLNAPTSAVVFSGTNKDTARPQGAPHQHRRAKEAGGAFQERR